jgi:TrmH family RNA methyltransferase
MGSVFRVKVFYRDPELFLKEYSKLLPVYGAYLDGENVLTSSLTSKGIIVIGSESHGIRQTLEPFITRKLLIPAFVREGGPHAESLNASVACGILLHEFRRREFSGQ